MRRPIGDAAVRGRARLVASKPAGDVSVRDVLAKFEAEFASVARAVANGEFALWVGSGISRQAPNLGGLIERAIEYLRERANDPASEAAFKPALEKALKLARMNPADSEPYYGQPFDAWPIREHEQIVGELWDKYSRLLDIRITARPSDFMLWEAVNVREAFAHPKPPAAEHLCIAILILEGAVRAVASGNWDGFIEAAVKRLSHGAAGVLQVVVDPNHMRDAAGKAKLLKFHGCILNATEAPTTFRPYLTGSHSQITGWANEPRFAAMRAAMTEIATNQKSLVLGLSFQDANLQGIFSAAKQVNPWPWPCAPAAAPGHVFCEDEISQGQRDVLMVVYGDAYNDDIDAIEAGTHLRAWAEQVLIALVLKLLADKLGRLMAISLHVDGKNAGLAPDLERLLKDLRDDIADLANGDRTAFTNGAIAVWSRLLSIFRTGNLPVDPEAYEVLSPSNPDRLEVDPNAQATGLGNLAIALALLQHGRIATLWELHLPQANAATAGALTARGTWGGASDRALFLVKSAGEAIALEKSGAFANDNAIVVHADDVWGQMGGSGDSARRLSRPPGRTGQMHTTHVCVGGLLKCCDDVNELTRRFVAAVTL